MSERWIRRCERVLERIKTIEKTDDRDRLELVRSTRYGLGALWNSLAGWMQWINNPDITTKFNQEELEDMNNTIMNFVKSFIEYDIKITKQGIEKGLKTRTGRRPQGRSIGERRTPEGFYV